MQIDDELIFAFSNSILIQEKLKDVQKRKIFLENLLKKPEKVKRNFLISLKESDEDLQNDMNKILNKIQKSKNDIKNIKAQAETIYKQANLSKNVNENLHKN